MCFLQEFGDYNFFIRAIHCYYIIKNSANIPFSVVFDHVTVPKFHICRTLNYFIIKKNIFFGNVIFPFDFL